MTELAAYLVHRDPGDEHHPTVQETARAAARQLIDGGAVILDTETTGLDETARLVELAILAADGSVLLDTLVQPGIPIPPAARAVHGIGDDTVASAPTLPELWPTIAALLADRPAVVCWNAVYDHRVISQHAGALRLPWLDIDWQCAMLLWHDWLGLTRRDRWWRLDMAAYKAGVPISGAHRARADAVTTLGVLRAMAERP